MQQGAIANNQPGGPRTKSFDNPSASSSTASSSGVGTSISSLNATNANLAGAGNPSGPNTPSVVKKYMEQKYGNNTNPMGNGPTMGGSAVSNAYNQQDKNSPSKNGAPRTSSGLFNQGILGQTTSLFSGLNTNNTNTNNNSNNNASANANATAPGTGLSSLTSQFTSGIANLKLTASNFQTNKFSSFLNNPFSS